MMDRVITIENVELSDIHNRPELITSLLYKKMLQKIDEAIAGIHERKFDAANAALQLCNDIITRLGFGIKYEAGLIADRLEMLYQYVFDLIYQANLKKDTDLLFQAQKIIRELDEAWDFVIDKEVKAKKDSVSGQTHSVIRLNPYQQREIAQEAFDYEEDN
jgi:flagellar protein FliS